LTQDVRDPGARFAINSTLFNVRRMKLVSLNFAVWSPFYRDLSLRSSHAWGVPSYSQLPKLVPEEANQKASGTRLDIEENEILQNI
jgi:hypothetical protein